MDINVDRLDLRCFLAVVDSGSFRAASERLHLSQPALSRRVQLLERRLGADLFERSTRRVVLTGPGKQFAPLARRVLEEIDFSLQSLMGKGRRMTTITAAPSLTMVVLPVLKQFISKNPHMRVRVLDHSPHDGLEAVRSGEVEFGVNMLGGADDDTRFTHLLDDTYVLVCHRRHALARKRSLTWSDLKEETVVSIGRGNRGNRAVLDAALHSNRVHIDWFHQVTNVTTVMHLVQANMAISVLPRLAVESQNSRFVTIKPITRPLITRPIGIVERRNGRLSEPATFLRDALLSHWRKSS